ncbi:2-isopropylmalate synthase [Bacterioplanes sanyensis]|uniref:2-isopropylmalate synthase n=1 Tax=Bacterioplanes sanyensis TaxID=1249553 RepID=UPI0016727AC1|nr:2-isopropylmalate synthase [Bacterioplanes sanyensis]GGY37063.1 2-isopropylmalate synthase [Bacterioplanes sanyensis]
MKDRLVIFDTTMRDGEQSPGASMTKQEKIRIGKALEKMRVDVIEAGFAAASGGDFESIQAVAANVRESTICSLARAVDRDLEQAAAALKQAERARIHTFIATSPIHMEHKLRMSPDQVVEQAVYAVKKARGFVDDVEFSCEDAGRSDIDFLCRIIEATIDAGARTINIPDTVGYAIPAEFGDKIRILLERIPNADKAIFSVHCHNDLGLAVANSLAAVANGARQVECTINGLGERAGNAALEEIVMATRTRADLLDLETGIDATQIVPTSRLVSSITGFPVQPNKAIVGANAFAHESGIHQDGVLKHRETYEIMQAEDVGWGANKMVMGKHSGRAAFRSRLEELGVTFETDELLNKAFARFKDLADKKHEIFDEDLQALVSETKQAAVADTYRLISLESHCATGETPVTEVVVSFNGEEHRCKSQGSGPVDAALKAIEMVAQSGANQLLYSVNAITQGTDSQGEVTVRLEKGGRIVNGQGADTDIITASAKAYIHALNQLVSGADRQHPQVEGV